MVFEKCRSNLPHLFRLLRHPGNPVTTMVIVFSLKMLYNEIIISILIKQFT